MIERDNLEEICKLLSKGGVILYPTDTIWGIGCDAFNEEAIDKVYKIKQRPRDKPLSILVDSLDMLRQFVPEIHPKLETLLAYHERPITVVYEKAKKLPKSMLAQDGSVAIRLVKDPFCAQLIQYCGCPLISSSANIHGEPFPANFGQISSDIIKEVDYVVKHRQNEKSAGEPSVMIRLSKKGELIFVRN
jgi:L-threonylcarbamoyladenylate synthase